MILLYNHQFQYQETHTQSIMTPVTRQPASSIHVASQASRYDYLNAAKKNLETTEQQQQQKQEQDYDQECFEEHGGDDACVSARRTTRNSKVKQQQQQQPAPSKKTVAFAQPAPAPAQQQKHEEQPTGKRVSKRQAAKYDAHKEAVEAANILASLAAAAAAASGPKERTPPYWTRQHEKAKSGARLQKSSVLQCD
jgi:hypothetical protein